MEEGRLVVAVYLDFSRGFDTVLSNISMHKVLQYRLQKSAVRLIGNGAAGPRRL